MGCWDKIKASSPEIYNYIKNKTGIEYNPDTKVGREEYLKAAKELQDHSVKSLNDIYAGLGIKGFEKTAIPKEENNAPLIQAYRDKTGVTKEVVSDEDLLKNIAEQAQNISGGKVNETGNAADLYKNTVEQTGSKDLVDAAIKKYPAPKEEKQSTVVSDKQKEFVDKDWFHGTGELNKNSEDKFYSTDESISGDYGDKSKLSESEKPKNPLVVGSKEDFADKIGYKGDPLAESLDTPTNEKFDTLAKKYAESKGHDAIIYESGTFDEPELHLFKKPITNKEVIPERTSKEIKKENIGKYEAKAREIADKINKIELPKWLVNTDPTISKSGLGADDLKNYLAEATILVGKTLDKGIELADAIKEGANKLVDDYVKGLGAARLKPDFEKQLRDGFENHYKENFSEPQKSAGEGVRISKAGLKEDYNFSKSFDERGGSEVATNVLQDLKKSADEKGIDLKNQIANEVEDMKNQGSKLEPTEHNIITAGAHLLNIDKQIKEAIANGENTENLIKQRDVTSAVLRQLGNKSGRNLGLFNLVFKDVADSEISVVRNNLSKILDIKDIPESLDALKNSDLTDFDKKRAEPYVKKIEELKKEREAYEQQSVKNISSLNDEEVQKAIKAAHEAGKKEGQSQGKDKSAKEKKSQQLKDLASRLRTSDEMDKFLKGSSNIQKSGLDLGSYKEIIANILDGVAAAVEKGEKLSDYLKKAVDKIKGIDKDKLLSDVQSLMTRAALPKKENVIADINKIAETENTKSITKSMVDKGLIKNIVDDVIHSDVPYDKVIETATNELKQHLPNVTKEDVADAYVRRNKFAPDKKAALENTIKQKEQDVRRLTNKEARLDALEAADDFHNADTKEEKEKVHSDYEKSVDKKISDLTKEKATEKKAQTDTKSSSDRLNEAKDAVQARIDAIREEIAKKERKLVAEELPLHEDVELGRMKEVEKALISLRDKYLPKEPEKFSEEKALKKRRVDLNNEISELNDQINSGKRKEKTGVQVEDTEHIKTLRKIKEEKEKLLDKIAPDYEKIKKQQDLEAKKHADKIAEIEKEIQYVKDSKSVYERAIKNPKSASEDLKAARTERDKTYSDNGLRVQKNDRQPIRVEREYQKAISEIDNNDNLSETEKKDKKAELKQQRDLDLQETKQGVISNLSDDISNLQNDITNQANDSEAGSEELKQLNKLNATLQGIRSGLSPTGENLEDIANKAYEKINKLLQDKSISKEVKAELQKIQKDFEDNTQLTSDKLAAKILKKQWERNIKTAQTKINSGTFTELPTTPYDFRRSVELTNLNRKRETTAKGLNNLILQAKEKNRTGIDRAMDFSTKLLVSGVNTVAKVGEAAVFKPFMDSVVEATTGSILSKLTDTPRTTFGEIKKGFKTLAAFKNKENADRYIQKLQDNKTSSLGKLQTAIEGGDKSEIDKAQKEFKKADLAYGISTLYQSIDANSLKTFWEYLAHGATDLDVSMGKGLKKDISDYKTKLGKVGYVLDGWIRTHAALKTGISARNEMMRSFASTLKYLQSKGMELNEENLALAHLIAENDFEAGRLSNATAFAKIISKGKNSKSQVARIITKTLAPVSTIAINIAKRGVDYSSLGIEGWTKLAKGAKEGMRINELEGKTYDTWVQKMKDGISQIPLKERKYINGVISRGLFGAALGLTTLWGLSNGQIKYGGTWDDRRKRKVIGSDGKVLEPDEWEFFGWKAPKLMDAFINHVPEMLPIALTSDIYQIGKLDKDGGALSSYIKTVTGEVQERMPFMTVAGLINRPAETLEDRFTRVPIAQDVEKAVDSKDRENKTLTEKLKTNVGLGFLNHEKKIIPSDFPTEIKADYDRTNDKGFLPPQVDSKFIYEGHTIELDNNQQEQFTKMVDEERNKLVKETVNQDYYKQASDEERKSYLKSDYHDGRETAKENFLNQNKNLTDEVDKKKEAEEKESEKQRQERSK